MSRPGCECWHHRREGAPTTIGRHRYTLDARERSHGHERWEEWRWLCSCNTRRRGQWTAQSDSVCYHAWLNHVKKWR